MTIIQPKYKVGDIVITLLDLSKYTRVEGTTPFQVQIEYAYFEDDTWKYNCKTNYLDWKMSRKEKELIIINLTTEE